MTLIEQMEIWKLQHDSEFWEFDIHSAVDKDALIDFLLYEYGDMVTVDSNSGQFRNHIKNFFKIHKWNIDKLAETLILDYDPLENVRYHTHRKFDEEEATDTDFDLTANEKSKGTEDVTNTHEMDWSENGTENREDVHLISAFNDIPSPMGNNYNDTEQYRDKSDMKYDKRGDKDDLDVMDRDTTGNKDNTEHTEQNKLRINDTHEDKDMTGHNSGSYQSLIEEERKQAQFNIYKWIGRHFCRELLIHVW